MPPSGVGRQRSGDGDPVVPGGLFQVDKGGVAAVDQVLGGQQATAPQTCVDAGQDLAVVRGGRCGRHVRDHVGAVERVSLGQVSREPLVSVRPWLRARGGMHGVTARHRDSGERSSSRRSGWRSAMPDRVATARASTATVRCQVAENILAGGWPEPQVRPPRSSDVILRRLCVHRRCRYVLCGPAGGPPRLAQLKAAEAKEPGPTGTCTPPESGIEGSPAPGGPSPCPRSAARRRHG